MAKTIDQNVCNLREMVAQTSMCVYNTQNMTRMLFDGMDQNGNVTISGTDYNFLVGTFMNWNAEHDRQLTEQEASDILAARYRYRLFLWSVRDLFDGPKESPTIFTVNDTEVGYITKGKIMGSYFPYHAFSHDTNTDLTPYVDKDSSNREKIQFDAWTFFSKKTPFSALALSEVYSACKAGDALLSIWTDLLLSKGVTKGTTLTVLGSYGQAVYLFRYERANGVPGTASEPDYVDRYELHPKMQFNEYYCYR